MPNEILWKHSHGAISAKPSPLPVDKLIEQQALIDMLKSALAGATAPLQLHVPVHVGMVAVAGICILTPQVHTS